MRFMTRLKRINPGIVHARHLSGISPVPWTRPPRIFPTTGFTTVPASQKLEEENWKWYTPRYFYPVHIGQVLHAKYQVLYKLGYGTSATVWMCRDLERDQYVCVKAMTCNHPSLEREIKAYEALTEAVTRRNSGEADLVGREYVREALAHFVVRHDDRDYRFLVHKPLGVSVQTVLDLCGGSLDVGLVRKLAYHMLQALQFIHSANVVHTDLQAFNILLSVEDETVFEDSEDAEMKYPSARKTVGHSPAPPGVTLFMSREHHGALPRWIGASSLPVLCDFGEARTGQDFYAGTIQPEMYRAPQVLLGLSWGAPVDIWSLGCMVWHFIFGRHLFSRTSEETADRNQIAQITALLGHPPAVLIADMGRSQAALEFFNGDGSPTGIVSTRTRTLETALEYALDHHPKKLEMTVEDAALFLGFMRRALTWREDERASAAELIDDPWIVGQ